jgi:hypothetical protein
MVKPILQPPIGHPIGPGLSNVLEQLERHCLAPDGSLMSRSAFLDLTQASALCFSFFLFILSLIVFLFQILSINFSEFMEGRKYCNTDSAASSQFAILYDVRVWIRPAFFPTSING